MAKVVAMPAKQKNPVHGSEETGKDIAHYQALLKDDPLKQAAYQKLMILYRKLKDLKSELRIIDAAIKAFEGLYSNTKRKDSKVASVSKRLNIAFGLTDKKGKMLYEQEPLATWKKRKLTVLNKMKQTKN